jgi:hypothetical protein
MLFGHQVALTPNTGSCTDIQQLQSAWTHGEDKTIEQSLNFHVSVLSHQSVAGVQDHLHADFGARQEHEMRETEMWMIGFESNHCKYG